MWPKLALPSERGCGRSLHGRAWFHSEGEVVLKGELPVWSSWRGSGDFCFELVGGVWEAERSRMRKGISADCVQVLQTGELRAWRMAVGVEFSRC